MNMNKVKKFKFYDSITLVSPTGQRAQNLREFLNILENSTDRVIFHHLFQSHIKYAYILRDFPNDFANWVSEALEDKALAEKLASFDPYHFQTVSQARDKLCTIIEEYLWDLPTVPWVRPGFEFYFSSATTIVAPTKLSATSIAQFRDALAAIPETSLYYHFYEARKRHKEKRSDDFSVWIETNFNHPSVVEKIRDIDFYFFSLWEVKEMLLDILEQI